MDQTYPEKIDYYISPKKKKKNRIMALKLLSHATIIQSRWRGAITRNRNIAIHPKERPVLRGLMPKEPINTITTKITSKQISVRAIEISNKSNNSFSDKKILFQNIKTIKLWVDFASGLPSCCTGTRITIIVVDIDRTVIDKNVNSSVSLPQFDCNYPNFSLQSDLQGFYQY